MRVFSRSSLFQTIFSGLLMVLLVSAAFAQSETATLSGTVTDPSQAVVQGAKVTVIKMTTSMKREVTTNKDGAFIVPMLSPGVYQLTVERPGFVKAELHNIVLNTADQRSVQVTLKVGGNSETTTVYASADTIDTSAATSTVVNRRFVENMPLNGRSFQSLLLLTPGVVQSTDGGLSVNGQRTNSNYYTVDGVSANLGASAGVDGLGALSKLGGSGLAENTFGGTNGMLSLDAMEEFKVQTSTYSAEYGRQPGGQVQLTTRSGTNYFHGTAFDYLRNDALDAKLVTPATPNATKTPLRQNDFGGTLSGPILRDKTFFFFAYEGLRASIPNVSRTYNVPSTWVRSDAKINPALLAIMNLYPLPTGPDNVDNKGKLTGTAKWVGAGSQYRNMDSYSLKLDHQINQSMTAFFRFSSSPSNSNNHSMVSNSITEMRYNTYTAGHTWLLKNTVSNELRFNYSTNNGESKWQPYVHDGGVMPSADVFLPAQGTRSWGLLGLSTVLIGDQGTDRQRQFNLVDNLLWTKGKHNLKFGADFRYVFPRIAPLDYSMTTAFTTLAALESNTATALTIRQRDPMTLVYKNLSLYAADSWHVTPKLTLDYGVRWEVNPAPHGKSDGDLLYVRGWQDPSTMKLMPSGTSAYDTFYGAFAPRVGASYRLRSNAGWETVLRGGYGMFYDLGSSMAGASAAYYPHDRSAKVTGANLAYPFSATALQAPLPYTIAAPYPVAQTYSSVVDNFTLPRTHQWNVAVEQSLGNKQALTVSYLGNAGRRLMRLYSFLENGATAGTPKNFNSPDFRQATIYVSRNDDRWGDTSDYDALQVQFKRSMMKGLQALANYTWGHAFDTNSSDYVAVSRYGGKDPGRTRGDSDNDRRQVLNVAISYDIPSVPKTAFAPVNVASKAVLSHWALDASVKAQTGTPFTVTFNRNMSPYDTGMVSFYADRVQGQPIWLTADSYYGHKRLNPDAFTFPASAMTTNPSDTENGNVARNSLRGYGQWQADFSLRREFPIHERVKLQFRGDLFNIFNHPNWSNPITILGSVSTVSGNTTSTVSSAFGNMLQMQSVRASSQGGLDSLYQNGGPRSVQLSLKLVF